MTRPFESVGAFLRPHDDDTQHRAVNRDALLSFAESTYRKGEDVEVSTMTLKVLLDLLDEKRIFLADIIPTVILSRKNVLKTMSKLNKGEFDDKVGSVL